MSETESVALVETARLEFTAPVTQAMRRAGERDARLGGDQVGPAAAGPGRRFRIRAGFAEHDERFGSSVQVDVNRPAPPDRDEAVTLIWPAIELETTQALGEGDWRPSLNWLDVIELRGEPPAIDIPPS